MMKFWCLRIETNAGATKLGPYGDAGARRKAAQEFASIGQTIYEVDHDTKGEVYFSPFPIRTSEVDMTLHEYGKDKS